MRYFENEYWYNLAEVAREVGYDEFCLRNRVYKGDLPEGRIIPGFCYQHWNQAGIAKVREFVEIYESNRWKRTRRLKPMAEAHQEAKTKQMVRGNARNKPGYMNQSQIAKLCIQMGIPGCQSRISKLVRDGNIMQPDLVTGVGMFWLNDNAIKIAKYLEVLHLAKVKE